jgi:hypothetical protein
MITLRKNQTEPIGKAIEFFNTKTTSPSLIVLPTAKIRIANTIDVKQGDRYGRLTIIKEVERRNGRRYFLCHCDCGNERIIPLGTMRQGKAKSCGCYAQERRSTHNETHTRLYHIWKTMKQRCNYEKHINFKNYGGRGISLCRDWSDFITFRDWALSNGYLDNLTIERLDVNGNYEPDNCTWATMKEQQNNKRSNTLITYNVETKTLQEWAETLGIGKTTLRYRLNVANWDVEKVFTQKVNHYDRH